MVIPLINGRLVHRVGVLRMLKAGLILQTTAGLWLVFAVLRGLGFWALVAGVVIFVGAIAAITSKAIAAAMQDYPQLAGTLASLAGTLRFGTGALTGFYRGHAAGPNSGIHGAHHGRLCRIGRCELLLDSKRLQFRLRLNIPMVPSPALSAFSFLLCIK
jgi:hypothetical protein